jgi:hypothetical protein
MSSDAELSQEQPVSKRARLSGQFTDTAIPTRRVSFQPNDEVHLFNRTAEEREAMFPSKRVQSGVSRSLTTSNAIGATLQQFVLGFTPETIRNSIHEQLLKFQNDCLLCVAFDAGNKAHRDILSCLHVKKRCLKCLSENHNSSICPYKCDADPGICYYCGLPSDTTQHPRTNDRDNRCWTMSKDKTLPLCWALFRSQKCLRPLKSLLGPLMPGGENKAGLIKPLLFKVEESTGMTYCGIIFLYWALHMREISL